MAHTSILEAPAAQPSNREGWFVLGGILGLLTLGLLLKASLDPGPYIPTSSDLPALVATTKEDPAIERHFAIVCSGFTKTNRHAKWFGNSSSRIYKVLKEQYGYSDESIYFILFVGALFSSIPTAKHRHCILDIILSASVISLCFWQISIISIISIIFHFLFFK